jgi:hypothetical protein
MAQMGAGSGGIRMHGYPDSKFGVFPSLPTELRLYLMRAVRLRQRCACYLGGGNDAAWRPTPCSGACLFLDGRAPGLL